MVTVNNQHRRSFGAQGEQAVASWLSQQGWTIAATNFSCPYGEIDIIARRADTVAFVEVKSRVSEHFPLAAVITRSKQRKIIKTAQLFVQKHRLNWHVLRFDVAFIRGSNVDQVEYIENAFTADNGE